MSGRHTTIYWRHGPRYLSAVVLLVSVLAVLLMWAVSRLEPGRHIWVLGVYFLLIPLWAPLWQGLYILSGGALVMVHAVGQARYVPLATAHLTRHGRFWRFSWQQGERWVSAGLMYDPALEPLLNRAVVAARARAAEGLPVPRTEAEAARAVALGWVHGVDSPLHPAAVAGAIALLGAALWLGQPLLLLPIPLAIGLLTRRAATRPHLVLTESGLWVTNPLALPAWVPTQSLRGVCDAGALGAVLTDRHPTYPRSLRRLRLQARFVRRLKTLSADGTPM